MAYTDDAVKAKLSALNETQESIVTVAQWIMFHRRYAERSAGMWFEKLKDSSASKRLNLIYLANEVVQQSKARKKDDFLISFSPIIADATASAYKGATNEVQNKIRRVVEVWRQRAIFEEPIQVAVESRISEIDKSRSSGKKALLGGSSFGGGSGPAAPPEIQPLIPLQQAVSKACRGTVSNKTAIADYDQLMDPTTPAPSAPVHAARLSALLKSLASAEGAVSVSIKARRDLISGLEKLLETNRAALAEDEIREHDFAEKKSIVEAKKREVEDDILRKLPSESPYTSSATPVNGIDATNGQADSDAEHLRPEMEELTPPPVEGFTPVESNTPVASHTPIPSPPHTGTDEAPNAFSAFDVFSPVDEHGGFQDDDLDSGIPKKRKLESAFGGKYRDPKLSDDIGELIGAESGRL